MTGHQQTADTPAGVGRADTPAGGGRAAGGRTPGGRRTSGRYTADGHTCLRYGGRGDKEGAPTWRQGGRTNNSQRIFFLTASGSRWGVRFGKRRKAVSVSEAKLSLRNRFRTKTVTDLKRLYVTVIPQRRKRQLRCTGW